jgi:hypothetical protein
MTRSAKETRAASWERLFELFRKEAAFAPTLDDVSAGQAVEESITGFAVRSLHQFDESFVVATAALSSGLHAEDVIELGLRHVEGVLATAADEPPQFALIGLGLDTAANAANVGCTEPLSTLYAHIVSLSTRTCASSVALRPQRLPSALTRFLTRDCQPTNPPIPNELYSGFVLHRTNAPPRSFGSAVDLVHSLGTEPAVCLHTRVRTGSALGEWCTSTLGQSHAFAIDRVCPAARGWSVGTTGLAARTGGRDARWCESPAPYSSKGCGTVLRYYAAARFRREGRLLVL